MLTRSRNPMALSRNSQKTRYQRTRVVGVLLISCFVILSVVACCAMKFRLLLLSLLLCSCAIGAEDRVRREYNIQPASPLLFEVSRTLSPCDPIPAPSGKGSVAYVSLSGNEFALHRKDQLSLSRTEVSGLTLRPT